MKLSNHELNALGQALSYAVMYAKTEVETAEFAMLKIKIEGEIQASCSKICSCGVPHDLHGTSCGWKNAGLSLNYDGVITEPRHPYFGKTFTQFVNEYK